MFILIKQAGRSITIASHPTKRGCEQADAIVQVDESCVTILKNWGVQRQQICGHPFSSIVSSDEGTHHCGECEEEK